MTGADTRVADLDDAPDVRKSRGAFFTPPEVCDLVVGWAIRSGKDDVLEPSCGNAAFLLSAVRRLKRLGRRILSVTGHEIHPATAETAKSRLAAEGALADIRVGDFLTAPAAPVFDVVVGNPPWVRYQDFHGDARSAGLRAALAQGVSLSGLASSWAPFVIHASAFLRPTGRLGLVLPAEFLTSNYASEVRDFVLRRFASVRVVLIDRHVFPDAQVEALLLLAEGTGGTDHVSFARARGASELANLSFDVVLRPTPGEKWSDSLVARDAVLSLDALRSSGAFTSLDAWGQVRLGAVTGANDYFALSPAVAKGLGLAPTDVVRMSPPGSTHLRAITLTSADYERLGAQGESTLLFRPERPSQSALRYIRQGEDQGVHEGYKCRKRKPWWKVPLSEPADLFFTYMSDDTPQLCANPLRLVHVNSLHGVNLLPGLRPLAAPLAVAALNSATMLSAEVGGRSYGGGILKMEPREAAALAVPSPTLVQRLVEPLRGAKRHVRRLLQVGGLSEAVDLIDELILAAGGCGLARDEIDLVRISRERLADRRQMRRPLTAT